MMIDLIIDDVTDLLSGWPDSSRDAALDMIEKYGAPDERTPSRMFWYDREPWKQIEVLKEAVPHRFPQAHEDAVRHTFAYKVPAEKLSEIASFDGSVTVERTRGELSAVCRSEPFNILTLNLSIDIASGKKTATQAREQLFRQTQALHQGRPQDAPDALNLHVAAQEDPTEPDVPYTGTAPATTQVSAGPRAGQEEERPNASSNTSCEPCTEAHGLS